MSEEGLQSAAGMENESEIVSLLKEDLEVNKENNKLLKRMHRNAMIALVAKGTLWLVILGVPLFFLGPYLRPLFSLVTTGQMPASTPVQGLFGLPTADELQQIVDTYTGKQ